MSEPTGEPPRPQQTQSQPQTQQIEIDWADEPPVVYANGAQIVNSQREFALLFTDFVAFAGRGNQPTDKPPKAKLVGNLRLTPDVFFQLVAAAASNWNKYVQRFGDPNTKSPKFVLVHGGGAQLEGLEPGDAPGGADQS